MVVVVAERFYQYCIQLLNAWSGMFLEYSWKVLEVFLKVLLRNSWNVPGIIFEGSGLEVFRSILCVANTPIERDDSHTSSVEDKPSFHN